MKRKTLSAVILILVFIATYIYLSMGIPGLRIKLDAEPMVYFIESLKTMVMFKSASSLAAGFIVGMLPFLISRKK